MGLDREQTANQSSAPTETSPKSGILYQRSNFFTFWFSPGVILYGWLGLKYQLTN